VLRSLNPFIQVNHSNESWNADASQLVQDKVLIPLFRSIIQTLNKSIYFRKPFDTSLNPFIQVNHSNPILTVGGQRVFVVES
jgi:hypothetical protein